MHLQRARETGAFFFSSAWQQKEMRDKNIAKVIVSGSKKIYPRHTKIYLCPISSVPPQGKQIHVNRNDVFQVETSVYISESNPR